MLQNETSVEFSRKFSCEQVWEPTNARPRTPPLVLEEARESPSQACGDRRESISCKPDSLSGQQFADQTANRSWSENKENFSKHYPPGRSKRGLKSGRPDRNSVWRSKNSRSVRAAASSLRSVVPASDYRLCRLRSVLGASASLFYSQPSRNSVSATQAQEIVSAQAPSDTPGGGRIADEKLQKVGELS